MVAVCPRGSYKMTKWPHLSPQAKNLKSKGTLLSSISKVKESKVPAPLSITLTTHLGWALPVLLVPLELGPVSVRLNGSK